MNIVSVCALAVVSAVIALSLRRYNQELSVLISIGAAVVILLSVLEYIISNVDTVTTILTDAGIDSEYIVILLKVMGICFLTEFTCDCTKEAGLDSLCSNIALVGKVLVLVTSLPMFTQVLSVVTTLVGGDNGA